MRTALVLALGLMSPLVFAATPQEEWHEYCEMTTHVHIDGWLVEKETTQQDIVFDSNTVSCVTEVVRDYEWKQYTSVDISLSIPKAMAGAKFFSGQLHHVYSLSGDHTNAEACKKVQDIIDKLANDSYGFVKVSANRELVRQDWISDKNTDVTSIESINLKVMGLAFSGSQSVSLTGKYCSKKP
jgi:hypothetical protein